MTGHTVGDNNQLLFDGTYDYEYDDEGNRTAKETIATGERVEYTWDHRNRLVTITFKNSLGVVLKTVDQAYDVNNQWVRSALDSNGATSGGVSERFFIYDGTQTALEFDGTTASDVSHRYLWGPSVDQLLADEQVSSVGSAGSVVWPLGTTWVRFATWPRIMQGRIPRQSPIIAATIASAMWLARLTRRWIYCSASPGELMMREAGCRTTGIAGMTRRLGSG